MADLDLLLLEVLRLGPTHGYGVISELKTHGDGVLDFPEGTVYPALHRLERDGLADSVSELVAGRVRRVYRLTPEGEHALERRRWDWHRYVTAVESLITGTTTPAVAP